MRRYDPKEIHLEVDQVDVFQNNRCEGIIIEWSSDIGYGEYQIKKDLTTNQWEANSECMDSNDDKAFLKQLLSELVKRLKITG